MKKFLLILSLLGVAPAGLASDAPEDIVRLFIKDYQAWNDGAYKRSRESKDTDVMKQATASYRKLIEKYCQPGFVHAPIAFGSNAQHHPDFEKVTGAQIKDERAIVHTTYSRRVADVELGHNYEYHLKRVGGKWYLFSVLYVDRDGKYEGL
jgi:hypothetical protein